MLLLLLKFIFNYIFLTFLYFSCVEMDGSSSMLEVYVDSVTREQEQGSTSHDFVIRLTHGINVGHYTHMKLEGLQLPVTWYVVPTSNNIFAFNIGDGSGTLRAAIPVGNYSSIYQLITAILTSETLEIVPRLVGSLIHLGYNGVTGRIFFRNLTGGTGLSITHFQDSILALGFPIPQEGINGSYTPIVVTATQQFTETINLVLAARWGVDAPIVAVLDFRGYVEVHSRALAGIKASGLNPTTEKYQSSSMIHRFAIPGANFSHVIASTDFRSGWTTLARQNRWLTEIDFQLRFPGLAPVMDMNGADWSFSMKFENFGKIPL